MGVLRDDFEGLGDQMMPRRPAGLRAMLLHVFCDSMPDFLSLFKSVRDPDDNCHNDL